MFADSERPKVPLHTLFEQIRGDEQPKKQHAIAALAETCRWSFEIIYLIVGTTAKVETDIVNALLNALDPKWNNKAMVQDALACLLYLSTVFDVSQEDLPKSAGPYSEMAKHVRGKMTISPNLPHLLNFIQRSKKDSTSRVMAEAVASRLDHMRCDEEWVQIRNFSFAMDPAVPRVLRVKSWKCNACGKDDSKKKCSKCKGAVYCSVDCQKADWEKHKKACLKQNSDFFATFVDMYVTRPTEQENVNMWDYFTKHAWPYPNLS